jgi:hypothetical protein
MEELCEDCGENGIRLIPIRFSIDKLKPILGWDSLKRSDQRALPRPKRKRLSALERCRCDSSSNHSFYGETVSGSH